MFRLLVPCAFACFCLPALSPTQANDTAPNKVNEGVVKFARDHIGKKVGDGECTGLVLAALKSVGAKTTFDLGVSGLDADYKWGKLIKEADARPGDIVQFRDVVTVTKTVKGTTTSTMTRNYPHHSAIIARNLGKGKFDLYEQNAGTVGTTEVEKRKVRENPLDLTGKKSGTVWFYRPVKK